MVGAPNVVLVCKSVFLRDMVAENLAERGIGILDTGRTFSDISDDCDPDVAVVVEATPGEIFGPVVISSLARRFAKWLVIGNSGEGSAFQRLRAFRSDISGIPLDIGKDEMYHAVTLAANSEAVCVGGNCRSCPSKEMRNLSEASLDAEQWEILAMLADGATNKHIANRFGCDESRVKGMIRRLLATIDVRNRTQAAVLAARAGL